ncbi:MAG: M42 family metallopeptidase [bacterium]
MFKELSEFIGVSGGEKRIKAFIRSKIEQDVEDIVEDPYGNLIVRKGELKKPRILLTAHMDEVGFMIIGIEKTGLLKFSTIGILPQVILAKRVIIGDKGITGVIGRKPIHQMKDDEKKKMPKVKDLFIDIGVTSKEEANKLVMVGDLGTFDTEYRENGETIFGKAFDDRIGCYILIQMLKKTDLPLYCAFTVQEEAGLRGAGIVAYRVCPDIAFAIDTTASGEWPSDKDIPLYPEIGKGPVITIADRSIICDKQLVSLIINTAKEHNIPYQIKKPMIGGTDAGPIHLSRIGVRTAAIQTPARYIHSPMSIVSKRDIESGIRLLTLSIENVYKKENLWN